MMNRVAKLSAALALVLAVAIGAIGKFHPLLFLRIPNIGFIPWAMTGNPVPPYFDVTVYDEKYFHEWAKDGDCILASGPKSGTVWVHNIVHLLKMNGDDNFTHLVSDYVGLAEFLMYPEQSIDLRLNDTQQKRQVAKKSRSIPAMTHFSHMSPSRNVYGMNVALHPNIRYLVTLRNLKEVVRSFYPFINSHSAQFREMWGGFPPPFGSPQDAVDFSIEHDELIFGHAKGWWNVRQEPNVLLVHFSDLKSHRRETIERIASFLDIPISDKLMNVTLQKSSFEYMKSRVDSEHPQVYGCRFGRPGQAEFSGVESHIHKGESDGANDFFTNEMEIKFNAALQDNLGDYPDLIKWLERGGAY